MEQMLEALLGPKWIEWKMQLSSSLGVDTDAAGTLLGGIAQQLMGHYSTGNLDLESLKQPSAVIELLGQLDLDALATQAEITKEKLASGLARIVPELVESAGAILGGGAGLGGILGNLDLS